MRIISLFVLLFINLFVFAQKPITYVIEVKEEINASSFKRISKGLKEAKELDAKYIIIHLNTYGGAVDAADSIRTTLLNNSIPTAVFIDNQAASAGALISIACDSIYMREGASIGAATVVNQSGEPMPDKYQSFMRAMMRSTAQANGRDPRIAEAMVDPSVYIEGVIDSAKVLSFTPEEAISNGYCEGVASSLEEAVALFIPTQETDIQKQKLTIIDRILLFFLTPAIQGLLLMVIVGGIYFELQTPGMGFPSAAALLAAILYFSPLYLDGLAQNWEIIVFVLGVLLILAEIFVIPGFGIAGVSGIILMITGLSFAMIDNTLFYYEGNFDFIVIIKPISIVLLSTFISITGSIYLAGKFLNSSFMPGLSLKTVLKESEGYGISNTLLPQLIGKTAVARTDMMPSGKIEIDGKWYEASLVNGLAVKGDIVVVTRSQGGRLYCERLDQ
ncbi:MAG: ATP-dependent Clp protease proteolytic subunit [Bacteroidales bacterium]|nr:ATP-dependent Clp protease proteolytic subunit [Bacteroidales bacterium]